MSDASRASPVDFTAALRDDLVEWVADGGTIRAWCRKPGHPTFQAIYKHIAKDPDLAASMDLVRDIGYEALAQDILAIADEPCADVVAVQAAKHRTWARLELLKKWHPKRYGDKQAVEHSGGVQITLDTGIRREANPSPAADDAT